ncbi:putative baseplate assembly protein [Klebsiella phage N1M2]|uniref:Putative baseplate assembly protein n=1 Tax=Klebsiella phage N1M2 TaxID=2664939 RepID=A0A6B7ZF39_9CAUD|nr:baseplate assembly protein [Klebsiella phage N1M2]QGH71982.1 putative baseplate assembly protein [Klebsiella phage N1M2]
MNVLECLGVGIVAMDKETNTDEIQVYIPSMFPEGDGEVTTQTQTQTVTTRTPTGDTSSSTTLSSNTVPATWLALNTNRVTAPDVRNGSKVVVYKFVGQSKYRWTYFGMDGTLRLETVIYAFSSSPNVDANTPVTPDNYYIFMISSHKKMIQLVTGQGNGEPTSYCLSLDTGNGQFGIVDGENNILSINSMDHAFSFINEEKSFLNIEKKNITMSCEDSMLLKGKNNVDLQCKDLKIKADNSIAIETQTTTWKSPTIMIEGDITHKGNTKQTGNYEQTGNYTIKGNQSLDGGFSQKGGTGTSEGDWTIGGISYLGHRHGGVKSGGDTSAGPQ